MKVADLIGSRKEVFAILESKSVLDAAKYLREKQGRSAGVVDAAGKLIGGVSQSDISGKGAGQNKCPAWSNVTEILTRDLVTVSPEVTFDDCLRLIEQHGVYHL